MLMIISYALSFCAFINLLWMIFHYMNGSSLGRTPIEKIVIKGRNYIVPVKTDSEEIFPFMIFTCLFLMMPMVNIGFTVVGTLTVVIYRILDFIIQTRKRNLEKRLSIKD